MSTYSDSDWAGCKRTARSTSGGVIMRGGHFLKSWSSTQKRVTLSSAEAELGALVKTTTETIGMAQLANGLGKELEAEIFVDSSAALGIVARKGCGKLRHIRVGQLWVQQLAEDEEVCYRKICGQDNPADLFTKHLNRLRIDYLLDLLNVHDAVGSAQEGLEI